MVRPGNRPYHASPSWAVLLDYTLGQRTLQQHAANATRSELVCQAIAYLQRCACRSPPRAVGGTRFTNVESNTRCCKTLRRKYQQLDKRRLLCQLNGQSRAKVLVIRMTMQIVINVPHEVDKTFL